MSLLNELPQLLASQFGLRDWPSLPPEVPGGYCSQDAAALLGRIALPHQERDHRELPFGRTSTSLNRTEAFLVISSSVSSSLIRFLA